LSPAEATRPARVLLVSTQPFFQWRGSSIRVKFNLLALESLGISVDLLAMPYGDDADDVKARVYRVPGLPGVRNLPIGPSAAKLVLDVFMLFRTLMLAVRHRYDVIHATEEGGVIGWLAARLTGARCIYEKHSDPASYAGGVVRRVVMRLYRAVERFTARHNDTVICTGPGLERQARSYAPEARIHHIPDIPSSLAEPGPDAVSAARETLVDDPEAVIVTYVGSFAVYQGVDLVFDAIPLVLEHHPRARFAIIGGTPAEIAHYRAVLGPAAESVRFTGPVDPDRLPAYLKASDILLAPRRAGINTPLKVLDYFKAGRAIVATDTEANRLILDADCAQLSPFRAEDFAAAIGNLVDDPGARERIAAEALQRYRTRYNFAVFTSQLATVYRELLQGARGIDAIPG